jgi:LAO/AO transport system kinase
MAQAEYQAALRLFPPSASGWQARVLTCSSLNGAGIAEIWDAVVEHHRFVSRSGHFAERRRAQLVDWFEEAVQGGILDAYQSDAEVASRQQSLLDDVLLGELSPSSAASILVDLFLGARFPTEQGPRLAGGENP